MEAIYAKLYSKYSKLKKEKQSPLDKLNREQELKFMNYVAAADEMIEYLKSENDKLHEQIDDLKSENHNLRGQVDDLKSGLADTRSSSDEQHIQCQKLLMEENQKKPNYTVTNPGKWKLSFNLNMLGYSKTVDKELSKEISKLWKLELQECSNCPVNQEIESEQLTSHQDSAAEGTSSKYVLRSAKKRKLERITEGTANAHVDGEHGRPTDCAPLSIQQRACQMKINSPGGDATDSNAVYCLFQCLVESVHGMKFSPHKQSSRPCIQALHQSSGYSFSLTWVPNTHGEAELVYRVLSLGTFEKVAPEWMREMLMFSTSMCNIFFERLSRVIKC
ncbi:uncharacterized protein [Primulina huaijiensis]|uniref:uncharacterized protein isoform X2 n=1 Tax=Primulina huaijiensis TaxID=1492673 RepID=UPI003CC7832C